MKYFKKIAALFISLCLFLPYYALGVEVNTPKTSKTSYIPMESAAINTGYSYNYDNGANIITLTQADKTITFNLSTSKITTDGTEKNLTAPIKLNGSKVYVNYDDVSFLFETPNDPYKNTKKQAVTSAYNYMETIKIPGFTVALTDAEKGYTWTQGFGYKDMGSKLPITKNTVFNIASISKVFTATALMQLVEQGKLDIKKPIKYYIPELNLKPHPVYGGDINNVTVEMAMTHYSGMPGDYFGDFYTYDGYNKNYMNNLVNNLSGHYMNNKENKRLSYSNVAVNLLGIIISRLSGENVDVFNGFSNYENNNIISKLNMKMSGFTLSKVMQDNLAGSYKSSSHNKDKFLYVNASPSGGLMSNSEDMVNFMNMILKDGNYNGNTILKKSSIDKMFTLTHKNMPYDPSLGIGLIWWQQKYKGLSFMGHGGDVDYFHSDLEFSRENKLGVFVSSNSTSSTGVSSLLCFDTLASAVSEKTKRSIADPVYPTTKDITLTKEQVLPFTGLYQNLGIVSCDDYGNVSLSGVDDSFIPQNDGTFYNSQYGIRFRFRKVEDTVIMFNIADDGQESALKERVVPKPVSSDFKSWLGEYTYVSTGSKDVVVIGKVVISESADGYPTFSISDDEGEPLSSVFLGEIDNSKCYILGSGRMLGQVVERTNSNGRVYLYYNGLKYVKASQ